MPCKPVNVSASGDNPLGIAAAGKLLRVYQMVLVPAGAVSITLKAGTGGGAVALTGPMSGATGTPVVLPFSKIGYFHFDQQGPNVDLNIALGGAVAVNGFVDYELY